VYVEEGAKKRPLGISTMFDRAVQILWAQALDPIVETASDPRSFGFRKNRSVKDAATYIYLLCGQMWGKRYIGKIDIKSFFDTISHEWLLKKYTYE
jgi:RNA-directed DNA polymerase